MMKHARVCLGAIAAVALTSVLAACGSDGSSSVQDQPVVISDLRTTTAAAQPIDVKSVQNSVRTAGSNLVVSAGWFDCHQTTPTTCTGEQPVGPKDNDAFDDIYDQYSDTCQELISRSNFRLDMAQRIRPWIIDEDANQVIADVNEQARTATATIKQTDGSSIVLHFDLATPYGVEAQCNSDGTLNAERR